MRQHQCVTCSRSFSTTINFAEGKGPKRCVRCRADYPDAYDGRKQTLHLEVEMCRELRELARKHERPVSWIFRLAWTMARDRMRELPSA